MLSAVEEPTTAAKSRRKNYTAQERSQILAELKKIPDGQKGSWMRDRGLYPSLISKWQSRGAVPLKRTVKSKPKKVVNKKAQTKQSELEKKLADLQAYVAELALRGKTQ